MISLRGRPNDRKGENGMKTIRTIVVAGAGTMGASMAETFARHGYEVGLYDVSDEALERGLQRIKAHLQAEIDAGEVNAGESAALLKRIQPTSDQAVFASADLLVEAIIESREAKMDFWRAASVLVKESAILASNTSGLSITDLASAVVQPGRFIGMHWINPPHIIPLIEVVKGEQTDEKTAQTIYDLCVAIHKKPVMVKDAPGFVLNRIQFAILRECLYITEEGIASPEDIDRVMKYALGIRYACLGPFEIADHGGLDIFHNIASYLFADLSNETKSFSLLAKAFEENNYGLKTGRGFYDYSDGKDKDAVLYRDRMYQKVAKCLD